MTTLTTHILIENNPQNLNQTLDSVAPLGSSIIIGDMGNSLETLELCKEYECKVIPVKGPRHEARNKLLEISNTDWQFYLEPGEVMSSGFDLMANLEGLPKRTYIVLEGIITKETRIFKKTQHKFINPVFETIHPDDDSEPINVFIAGTEQPNRLKELLEWKKQAPQSADADYYLACQYLILKDYNKFISHAQYFLFKEINPIYSAIMTKYYMSQIYLHVKKNSQEAINNLIYCLIHKPLMAEFWCLLGDCYYRAGVPEKAIEFFRIAIEMGKSRQNDDPYPIELSKYNEYPTKMIDLCDSIITTTLPYRSRLP